MFSAYRIIDGERYPADIADTYFQHRGACAFLVLNGPSLADSDRELLSQPGVMTAGVNNGAAHFRPHFWFSVDAPARFLSSIWLDPRICKFVGDGKAANPIRDEDKWNAAGCPNVGDFKTEGTPAYEINQQVAAEHPKWDRKQIKVEAEDRVRKWHAQWNLPETVGDCPNVVFCKLHTEFDADTFLTEPHFTMGNSKEHGGGRSVMLFALKSLYVLGFRRVFLVGCDWYMAQTYSYGFKEKRHQGAVDNNNTTFGRITSMFTQAREHFAAHGFSIENCNDKSFLTVFPYRPLSEAVEYARAMMPEREETQGRYQFKL